MLVEHFACRIDEGLNENRHRGGWKAAGMMA
jgi:hypothetical protein